MLPHLESLPLLLKKNHRGNTVAGCPKSTLWRLNAELKTSNVFKSEMSMELKTYLEYNDNGTVSPVILFDAAKAYLRGKIIAQCAMLKKIRIKKLSDLQDK